MRKFYVKVKKINYESKSSSYVVFTGVIYKKNKKNNELKVTSEKVICCGHFISLYVGDTYYIEANKFEHKIYGEQYKTISYNRILPGTLEEIEKFLIQRGRRLGIKRAKEITSVYGLDTLNCIISNPKALDGFGLPQETIDDIRQSIFDNQEFEQLLIFLRVHKINSLYASLLYKELGNMTVSKLKSNPYIPFIRKIWSFEISDMLSAGLGYAYNTSERVFASIYAAIQWDSESGGNLYLPAERLMEITKDFLNSRKTPYLKNLFFSEDECVSAISELENLGIIVIDKSIANESIYLIQNRVNEIKIAEELCRIMKGLKTFLFNEIDIKRFIDDYELKSKITLETKQREAVKIAMTSPVSIITGGPGTGKTHTTRTLIACIKTLAPSARICLCAPTGKAAIRAEEMSGLPASTIHRMLKLFIPNQELKAEELECDFLIVDEYSMVDAFLCNRLFTATSSSTRIVMVGDYNQLPSVGPGLVLRDFINSKKIQTVELSQVFRQTKHSKITQNATEIISVKENSSGKISVCKKEGGDFYFLKAETPCDIRLALQKSIHKLKRKYNIGINDVQILTPVKNTALGSTELNLLFQNEFLPKSTTPLIEIGEREFRLNDKVIHIKNNSEYGVFNGEVGYIKSLNYEANHMLTVEYPDKTIDYSLSMLDELELAYSMTVHKSQGSEFQVVIIPIHDSIMYGMNKHVLYTALTRAKKMVILIGDPNALKTAIRNQTTIGERRSHLIERMNIIM